MAIARIVLVVLYRKRMNRDSRKGLEDRQREDGFYAHYVTQRFGTEGAAPSTGRTNHSHSRRTSGDSIYDFKQDHPHHLAQLPGNEPGLFDNR
ncbi:uncharacterized protein N7479_009797 [Penicillium vulpinum]|uniref:uncharacterized protein n=1 Tax=Penicillium vulpinum TaxID=29845 RepID=UPI002547F650|nr:uncharacterized protein N7479_009797 [Penicillium vulpinum]KAJ5951384.1 hypothetical protein N7479_009797 [Penicillium vulpinum]